MINEINEKKIEVEPIYCVSDKNNEKFIFIQSAI